MNFSHSILSLFEFGQNWFVYLDTRALRIYRRLQKKHFLSSGYPKTHVFTEISKLISVRSLYFFLPSPSKILFFDLWYPKMFYVSAKILVNWPTKYKRISLQFVIILVTDAVLEIAKQNNLFTTIRKTFSVAEQFFIDKFTLVWV